MVKNNDKANSIALLRYRIISPLIGKLDESYESSSSFFRAASEKVYKTDDNIEFRTSASTIKRWYYSYMKFGFNGLIPSKRIDCGSSRKIDNDIRESIKNYKTEFPGMSATLIYETLIHDGIIRRNEISLSTINREVNKIKKDIDIPINKDRKRYEREHINEVWAGDTMYGPFITVNGKKVRTYVIAFQDDASRMIVGASVYFNDTFENVMDVIQSSIIKYGKPKVFNLDNGKSYKNKQIELISARIGVVTSYAPPFTPESKAKIERFFLTLRKQWLSMYRVDSTTTIEDMRESLTTFINNYNLNAHSSLKGKSPKDRFFSESELIIRMNDEDINTMFLIEVERRVTADNVIKIYNKEYEVPNKYCNQRITLRYTPTLDRVYVLEDDTLIKIELLDKVANSLIKRKKPILAGGAE